MCAMFPLSSFVFLLCLLYDCNATEEPKADNIMPFHSADYQEWRGGTNDAAAGVSHNFIGLDTSQYAYSLTVEIYDTGIDQNFNFVEEIYAGSVALSVNCDSSVRAVRSYRTCVSAVDVTGSVTSFGSLSLRTTASSGVKYVPHDGFDLYVRYYLSKTSTIMIRSLSTTVVRSGGTNSPTYGVTVHFSGLNTILYTYALTVEVVSNDYDDNSEYVDGVYAGSTLLESYCNPGIAWSTSYFTCVSSQDVTGYVNFWGGALAIKTTATSDVNHLFNSFNYALYVRCTIVGTRRPYLVREMGAHFPSYGASGHFNGLDTYLYTYSLTVMVYETDFDGNNEYVDGIYAGSTTLTSYCNPGTAVGGAYYTCISYEDVTESVNSTGSLFVKATATSTVDISPYNGYVLYVKFILYREIRPVPTSPLPTEVPSSVPIGDPTCESSSIPTGEPTMLPTSVPSVVPTGIPTSMPSGEPSYMPTALPTASPVWEGGTNQPTSGVSHVYTGLNSSLFTYTLTVNVYETDFDFETEYVDGIHAGSTKLDSFCNPGVQGGGGYFTCVANRDVTEEAKSGSLRVHTTATVDVNVTPYLGFTLYVQYILTRKARTTSVPTFQPTRVPPSSLPYALPSQQPTGVPTTLPSNEPTAYSTLRWEGGTNIPSSGVSHTFTGLGPTDYSYALTVEVYETDFAGSAEYVDNIYSGSTTLTSYCNPGLDRGGRFYRCVTKRIVDDDISASGILTVGAHATGDINAYPYMGYTFYVKYTLMATALTVVWESSTDIPMSEISHTFPELDTSHFFYSLTVEVQSAEHVTLSHSVDGIYVDGLMLSTFCDSSDDDLDLDEPYEDDHRRLEGSFMACIDEVDVTNNIGGDDNLDIRVVAPASSHAHLGYRLYVRLTLHSTPVFSKVTHASASSSDNAIGKFAVIVIILLGSCCVFCCAVLMCLRYRSMKRENISSTTQRMGNDGVSMISAMTIAPSAPPPPPAVPTRPSPTGPYGHHPLPNVSSENEIGDVVLGNVDQEGEAFSLHLMANVPTVSAVPPLPPSLPTPQPMTPVRVPVACDLDCDVEASSSDDEMDCWLCYSAPKDHVFMPCGHMLLCGGCVIAMRDSNGPNFPCPVCRAPVTDTVRGHFS